MKKSKIIIFIMLVLTAIVLTGCTDNSGNNNTNSTKISSNNKKNTTKVEEKIDYVEEISVYNAAEYMSMDTIKDFEKEYKIKVNYKEFESNEDMYEDFVKNSSNYDVLVPSDYMIDRLIKEDRLEKLNKNNITNLSNVSQEYLNPEYDKSNDYVVPYMTGTLGILYNKKLVNEPVTSWNILWDSKYKGQIWLWDSMRDVIRNVIKTSRI